MEKRAWPILLSLIIRNPSLKKISAQKGPRIKLSGEMALDVGAFLVFFSSGLASGRCHIPGPFSLELHAGVFSTSSQHYTATEAAALSQWHRRGNAIGGTAGDRGLIKNNNKKKYLRLIDS